MMKLQFMIKHFSDNFQGVHCLSVHCKAISEITKFHAKVQALEAKAKPLKIRHEKVYLKIFERLTFFQGSYWIKRYWMKSLQSH